MNKEVVVHKYNGILAPDWTAYLFEVITGIESENVSYSVEFNSL